MQMRCGRQPEMMPGNQKPYLSDFSTGVDVESAMAASMKLQIVQHISPICWTSRTNLDMTEPPVAEATLMDIILEDPNRLELGDDVSNIHRTPLLRSRWDVHAYASMPLNSERRSTTSPSPDPLSVGPDVVQVRIEGGG